MTPDEALVARLLAAVGGDVPMEAGVSILAPDVVCHMDGFTARGVAAWVDWVEFIRSWAAPEHVKVVVERLETGADGVVIAFGGVTVGRGVGDRKSARYRIVDGRIAEIWTSRWNYEMIFGAKVRHPLRWLLVLVWMAVWRRLPRRRRALVSPTRGGLGDPDGDGGGSKPRGGSSPDDHPEW